MSEKKIMKAVEIIPDQKSALHNLQQALFLESSRFITRASKKEGLGSKGIRDLEATARAFERLQTEKRAQEREDTVSQLTEEQLIEAAVMVIKELSTSQKIELLQLLQSDPQVKNLLGEGSK